MYKFFERNEMGNDFVCGDIHGCIHELFDELDALGFNKNTDRLFVVGDLVDRGPDSYSTLKLLNEPWFFSTMGNHEALMINSAMEHRQKSTRMMNSRIWFDNGGTWWLNLDTDEQDSCVELAKQLPIIIEVQVGDKRIGLIHAEIFDLNWQEAIDSVKDVKYNDFVWDKQYPVGEFLWSRKKIQKCYSDDVSNDIDGIDHVFHGHTILGAPRTLSNCTYIDTGCVRQYTGGGGYITILNLNHLFDK
jgi:serine/threonine protein phosphatase 1